ncbi:hypothetical protein NEOLEDRAFT_1178812 [Neolentinus lepideus HHB14362 ss-1]|uniref:Uncharacterized protein n=1 Tax=Neolentinus lepideus HHB14362 ss-1 TaxID=1314782 RepID=A0A165SF18_9AGAM|nr:hypothetical protein NEOLEDRAFT_1178812 [Neolentinus lepideus HHB14362 ss-1]
MKECANALGAAPRDKEKNKEGVAARKGSKLKAEFNFWNQRSHVITLNDTRLTISGLGSCIQTKESHARNYYKIISSDSNPGRVLVQRGEGDDQHPLGVDGALLPWLNALTNVLAVHFLCTLPSDDNILLPPRVTLVPAPSLSGPLSPASLTHATTGPPSTSIGTSRHRHLEFDFVQYQTLPPFLPSLTTLHHLLVHHLSILAIPRRAFWETPVHWLEGDKQGMVEK